MQKVRIEFEGDAASLNSAVQKAESHLEALSGAVSEVQTKYKKTTKGLRAYTTVTGTASASTSEYRRIQHGLAQDLGASVQKLKSYKVTTNQAAAAQKTAAQAAKELAAAHKALAVASKESNLIMGKGAELLGVSFTKLMVGVVAFDLAYKAIGLVSTSASDVFTYGMRLQGVEAAMLATAGSAQALASELKFLDDLAEESGSQVTVLRDQYKLFSASAKLAKVPLEEIHEIYTNMTKVGRTLNLSTSDMEGTFRALTQMMNKNKITLEELQNQLGERLPGAVALMAKSMGISIQELLKKTEQGLLTASDNMLKFTQAAAESFGGDAYEKARMNLQAELNRSHNAWVAFSEQTFALVEETSSSVVRSWTEMLEGLILDDLEGAQDRLNDTIDAAVGGVQALALALGVKFVWASRLALLEQAKLAQAQFRAAQLSTALARLKAAEALAIGATGRAAAIAAGQLAVVNATTATMGRTALAASVGVRVLGGAIALLGGPIGVVALGITAFVLFHREIFEAVTQTGRLEKATRESNKVIADAEQLAYDYADASAEAKVEIEGRIKANIRLARSILKVKEAELVEANTKLEEAEEQDKLYGGIGDQGVTDPMHVSLADTRSREQKSVSGIVEQKRKEIAALEKSLDLLGSSEEELNNAYTERGKKAKALADAEEARVAIQKALAKGEKDSADGRKKGNKALTEAEKLIKSLRTPQEVYAQNLTKYEALYAKGEISLTDLNRARAREKETLDKALESLKKGTAGYKDQEQAARELASAKERLATELEDLKAKYDVVALTERKGAAAGRVLELQYASTTNGVQLLTKEEATARQTLEASIKAVENKIELQAKQADQEDSLMESTRLLQMLTSGGLLGLKKEEALQKDLQVLRELNIDALSREGKAYLAVSAAIRQKDDALGTEKELLSLRKEAKDLLEQRAAYVQGAGALRTYTVTKEIANAAESLGIELTSKAGVELSKLITLISKRKQLIDQDKTLKDNSDELNRLKGEKQALLEGEAALKAYNNAQEIRKALADAGTTKDTDFGQRLIKLLQGQQKLSAEIDSTEKAIQKRKEEAKKDREEEKKRGEGLLETKKDLAGDVEWLQKEITATEAGKEALEKFNREKEIYNVLTEHSLDLQSKEGLDLAAMVRRKEQLKEQLEAMQKLQAANKEWQDGFSEALLSGEDSLKSFFLTMIQQAAQAQFQMSLFGSDGLGGLVGVAADSSSGLLSSIGGFLQSGFGGFRADGGSVSRSKSYIVGERGPELFSPGTSGQIIPNNALTSAASGVNVNYNPVINITGDGSQITAEDIQKVLKDQMNKIPNIINQQLNKGGATSRLAGMRS